MSFYIDKLQVLKTRSWLYFTPVRTKTTKITTPPKSSRKMLNKVWKVGIYKIRIWGQFQVDFVHATFVLVTIVKPQEFTFQLLFRRYLTNVEISMKRFAIKQINFLTKIWIFIQRQKSYYGGPICSIVCRKLWSRLNHFIWFSLA